MAFTRPSYTELVTRIQSDLRAQLVAAGKRADSLLRRTRLWVLAHVYAAIFHTLYEALDWISRQILPTTATDLDYLIAFGRQWGIERKLAEKSAGVVTFTGDPTTVIPEGTEFLREDGFVYVTTEEGTVGGGGTVDVDAEADLAGSNGNMDADTILSLASPIVGIDAVEWESGWSTGTDDEELEPLRSRILQRTRTQPQGGAAADFIAWMLEVPGVFRAYSYANLEARGAGTVDGYFLHESGTGYGLPDSGQIAEVTAYVLTKCPVICDFEAQALTAVDIDITFTSLTPDNSGIREAIEDAIDELCAARALLGTSAGTIYPSEIWAAIDAAPGVTAFALSAPTTAFVPAAGEVPVRGTITWPV